MKMIESRCGIICSECEFKSKIGCAGCINIEHPFWGEICPVKLELLWRKMYSILVG